MSKITVVSNVLKANDDAAADNRRVLDAAGVVAINLISAPGSGKTSLLERTITDLPELATAVLVGDLQTSRDAERVAEKARAAVQINTGRGCHLSAEQVREGLKALDLDDIDRVFIENVGNMVCPVSFDLGEHHRVALLSVPEGDDKVAKYPTLFQSADVVILNKIDLLDVLDFELDRVRDDLARVNTGAPFIQLSTKTGQGLDDWYTWLRDRG